MRGSAVLGAYQQVPPYPADGGGRFLGRLPPSMVGLGTLLVGEDYTGSYALGGAVAATGAVTTSLFGPMQGWAADAYGQRKVLLPILAVFVVAGTAFLWAVREDQSRWISRGSRRPRWTHSQNSNMLAVSMPNSATFSAFVLTANEKA